MDAKRLSDLRIEYQTYGPLKEIVEDLLDDAKEMSERCAVLEAKCADLEQRLDKMTRERDVLKKALSDKLKKTLRNLVDFYLEQNVDKQLRPGQFAEAARAATDAAKEGESDGLA